MAIKPDDVKLNLVSGFEFTKGGDVRTTTMPRPKTKDELFSANADKYEGLMALVDSLSRSQLSAKFPFEHRDKNVRDVLAHLHAWQLMMLEWYTVGMEGGKPEMPSKGYSWKTTPELNASIWSKYQAVSLKVVRNRLEKSHHQIQQIVESHSDEELFTKRYYPWTGTTSLGSYLTSSASSHCDWAYKLLRRFVKAANA